MSFPFSKRVKKPMSRQDAQKCMDGEPLEKGDLPAMIIAAFLVYFPAVLLVIGLVLGLSYFFLFRF